ncbi:MAG: hypothetical protein MJ094_01620 [Saccharofermentans sp.]|nr:hypothetical protein [Saccharofermentans sp.]
MKKVGIFSRRNVKSAYSCLLYLKESLEKKYEVHLWAFTEKKDVPSRYNLNFHSFVEKWYGKIRLARTYIAKIEMYFEAKKYDVIIINDLDFFRMGYWIKKKHPDKIVVHYNTEIHGMDVRYPWHTVHFYNEHADYPDMIIECLQERADYRRKTFNIQKPIYTINNTLPNRDLEESLSHDLDVGQYVNFDNSNPIVVYAGGCYMSRCLGDIIKASSHFEGMLNFLFFCYGKEKDFNVVKIECAKHSNCRVFSAVSKDVLFNVLNKCDIGIQYYDPSISVNHLYASPSKFYEYIGLGLNVLSSNNIGINRIISNNNFGVCLDSNRTILDGLNELLEKGLTDKDKIKKAFKEKYSYEVNAQASLDRLFELID